jgi:excisionase family DNA binding protein
VTERLLTAAEVADLLNLPESWVREATRQDRLPHLHLGRYIRYHPTAITDWLTHQTSPSPSDRAPRRR